MEQHNETVIVLSFLLINPKVHPHSEAFLFLLQGRVNNYTLIVKTRTDVLDIPARENTHLFGRQDRNAPDFFTSFDDETTALALSISQASCLTLFLHSRNDIPI